MTGAASPLRVGLNAAVAAIGTPQAGAKARQAAACMPDPQRVALLLRAMAVLRDGGRADIAAIVEVARRQESCGDIAVLLEVVLAGREGADPAAVKQQAIRAGSPARLPVPGLLRFMAAKIAERRTRRPKELGPRARLPRGLALVSATLHNTTAKTQQTSVYLLPGGYVAPNVAPLMTALEHLFDGWTVARQASFVTALGLRAERWPALFGADQRGGLDQTIEAVLGSAGRSGGLLADILIDDVGLAARSRDALLAWLRRGLEALPVALQERGRGGAEQLVVLCLGIAVALRGKQRRPDPLAVQVIQALAPLVPRGVTPAPRAAILCLLWGQEQERAQRVRLAQALEQMQDEVIGWFSIGRDNSLWSLKEDRRLLGGLRWNEDTGEVDWEVLRWARLWLARDEARRCGGLVSDERRGELQIEVQAWFPVMQKEMLASSGVPRSPSALRAASRPLECYRVLTILSDTEVLLSRDPDDPGFAYPALVKLLATLARTVSAASEVPVEALEQALALHQQLCGYRGRASWESSVEAIDRIVATLFAALPRPDDLLALRAELAVAPIAVVRSRFATLRRGLRGLPQDQAALRIVQLIAVIEQPRRDFAERELLRRWQDALAEALGRLSDPSVDAAVVASWWDTRVPTRVALQRWRVRTSPRAVEDRWRCLDAWCLYLVGGPDTLQDLVEDRLDRPPAEHSAVLDASWDELYDLFDDPGEHATDRRIEAMGDLDPDDMRVQRDLFGEL